MSAVPLKWTRTHYCGFMRYEAPAEVNGARIVIRIAEGRRNANVKAGWGHGAHSRTERYWHVMNLTDRHKTIGHAQGWPRLSDAKAAAAIWVDCANQAHKPCQCADCYVKRERIG